MTSSVRDSRGERAGVEHVAALLADARPEAVCEAVVEALARDGMRARISRQDGELVCGEPAGSGTAAAAPIVVGGAPWGAVSVDGRLPEGIEGLLAAHAALVAAAVSADAAQATARRLAEERDALAASRERILAATDATRRRFERDLHDGAQQRLVTLGFELRLAEADLPEPVRPRIARAVERVEEILAELRELSRGLHPAILSEGGLRPGAAGARAPLAPCRSGWRTSSTSASTSGSRSPPTPSSPRRSRTPPSTPVRRPSTCASS